VEKLLEQFDEFQKKPWQSDPIIPRPDPLPTPAVTRTYKRRLLGTWKFEKYELKFDETKWNLSFGGEMLIRPLSILEVFHGPYNLHKGSIGFIAGLRGSALFIAQLDESELVLTDGMYFTGRFRRANRFFR